MSHFVLTLHYVTMPFKFSLEVIRVITHNISKFLKNGRCLQTETKFSKAENISHTTILEQN